MFSIFLKNNLKYIIKHLVYYVTGKLTEVCKEICDNNKQRDPI